MVSGLLVCGSVPYSNHAQSKSWKKVECLEIQPHRDSDFLVKLEQLERHICIMLHHLHLRKIWSLQPISDKSLQLALGTEVNKYFWNTSKAALISNFPTKRGYDICGGKIVNCRGKPTGSFTHRCHSYVLLSLSSLYWFYSLKIMYLVHSHPTWPPPPHIGLWTADFKPQVGHFVQ